MLDDASVYWPQQQNSGHIMRVAKAGGAPSAVSTGARWPWGLAMEDGKLFYTNWINNGGVHAVPVTGGPSTELAASLRTPRRIAVHASECFRKSIAWNR